MTDFDPEEKSLALIKRFAKPCIFIHRPYPPRRHPKGRSKLGGLPNLPDNIEWPIGKLHIGPDSGPVPLHFFAQIDCSELPRVDDKLPASGMLFFFANIDESCDWDSKNANDYRRVVYVPNVPADQQLRQPPGGIPDIEDLLKGNLPAGYFDAYEPSHPLTRKVFYEWPVEFLVTDSYLDVSELQKTSEWADLAAEWERRADSDEHFCEEFGREDLLGMMDAHENLMSDNVRAALGLREVNPLDPFPPHIPNGWRKVSEVSGRPFPPTAETACIMAAQVDLVASAKIAEQEESYRLVQAARAKQEKGMLDGIFDMFKKAPPQPQKAPQLNEIHVNARREAREWLTKFRSMPREQEIAPEDRERLLAWYDDIGEVSDYSNLRYFQVVVSHIATLSASEERYRKYFTDEILEMFDQGGALLPQHQMLGNFHCEHDWYGFGKDMVPLLMLSYDGCTGMRICDVGQMHFFISERDLKDRNFAHVQAQMQGG